MVVIGNILNIPPQRQSYRRFFRFSTESPFTKPLLNSFA